MNVKEKVSPAWHHAAPFLCEMKSSAEPPPQSPGVKQASSATSATGALLQSVNNCTSKKFLVHFYSLLPELHGAKTF